MVALTALADVLYREEVARARAMDPGEKLLEGRVCSIAPAG
jgi:hypothetical protein